MRQFALIMVFSILAALAAQAQPVKPLIDKWFAAGEPLRASKLNMMVGRMDKLEADQESFLHRYEFAAVLPRSVQLERKVRGMQKQITILHAMAKK